MSTALYIIIKSMGSAFVLTPRRRVTGISGEAIGTICTRIKCTSLSTSSWKRSRMWNLKDKQGGMTTAAWYNAVAVSVDLLVIFLI
jgi:hypothetical protein